MTETAARPEVRPAYRPQRVRVPRESRGWFFLAVGTALVAYAVVGLFTALDPIFVSGQLWIKSLATSGAVVFATLTAAASTQIVILPLSVSTQVGLGTILLVVGIASLAPVVVTVGGLALFPRRHRERRRRRAQFKAVVSVAASLSGPANRGEVLAGIFLLGTRESPYR